MLRSSVPFVLQKTIFRVTDMRLGHQSIPCDFGDDRGGGHSDAEAVSLDHDPLFDREPRQPHGVQDQVVGLGEQLTNRLLHRQTGRFENVHGIDNLGVHNPDTNADRPVEDLHERPFALSLREELGVANAFDPASPGKDHRRCDDRARQRPPPGFIETGYPAKPPHPGFGFEDVVGDERHDYTPAVTPSGAAPTGTVSVLGLPSARYSRSATRVILPFFVRR